jgi:hypothetical protein
VSKEHPFPDKNIGFAGYRPILNFKTTFTVEGTVPLATSIYRWIFHENILNLHGKLHLVIGATAIRDLRGCPWGFPWYPNSWMVMENQSVLDENWGYLYFRKPAYLYCIATWR